MVGLKAYIILLVFKHWWYGINSEVVFRTMVRKYNHHFLNIWGWYPWLISDLIPKNSEILKFRKNFETMFKRLKKWSKNKNFDIVGPRILQKWPNCGTMLTDILKRQKKINFGIFRSQKFKISKLDTYPKNVSFRKFSIFRV